MNWLINLGSRLAGLGKAFEWLDGKKSYLAGTALILAGAAGLLNEVVAIHDASAALEFGKHLLQDPNWLRIAEGLGVIGVRHGISKAAPVPAQ